MLSGLKNLFTTSGICFVFVAGKDLHEKWVRDLWRGDSVYESIFSYDRYLPCMWSDIDQICDRLTGFNPVEEGSNAEEIVKILKQYLRFKGRGTPRRFIRSFNEMVKWRNEKPEIPFQNEDLRRVTFFARLNETLEANNDGCLVCLLRTWMGRGRTGAGSVCITLWTGFFARGEWTFLPRR